MENTRKKETQNNKIILKKVYVKNKLHDSPFVNA